MSTDVMDVMLPCCLVAALYGAGIITGIMIAKADSWLQVFGPKEAA